MVQGQLFKVDKKSFSLVNSCAVQNQTEDFVSVRRGNVPLVVLFFLLAELHLLEVMFRAYF